MKFILLSLLFAFNAIANNCPSDPGNWIIMIDSCPTKLADRVHRIKGAVCQKEWASHAEEVIEVYKHFGGKSKIWLFPIYSVYSNDVTIIRPILYALKCGIKTITLSGGGDVAIPYEHDLIKDFVASGGRYYAAAGNENNDIQKIPYYPASYKEVIAVGAIICPIKNKKPIKESYSSYGNNVKRWNCGMSIRGNHGTSFSVPRILVLDKR